ncbi:axial budding pattern protein 2 [Microdochium nivale]|nr:axial budding pattern protein 2 [Microdochium nivale]
MAVLPRETSAPQRHASPTLYLRQAASKNNSTTALPSVSAALASPTSQPPLSVDSPFSPQEGGNAAHGTAAGPRQAQMAIGVAVGIILLLLIGVTIALCCRFRRRRHASSSNNRSGHDPAGSEEDIAEKDPNHTQQTPDRRLRGLALVAKVNGNNNSSSGDGMWTTMAGGDVAAPQRVKGENNTSPQRQQQQQQQQQQRYGSGDYEHWFSRHQDRRQKIYHAVSRLGGDEVKDGSDGRGNGAGWEKINTYAK